MSFYEYQVELEATGELRGFDTWEEAKQYVVAKVYGEFQPFAITCVKYLNSGELRTLWEIEWTDPSMRCNQKDRQYFRKIDAKCLYEIFRMA